MMRRLGLSARHVRGGGYLTNTVSSGVEVSVGERRMDASEREGTTYSA